MTTVSRGEGTRIIGAAIWRRITLFISQQKRPVTALCLYKTDFFKSPYHRFCITSSSSTVVPRSSLSSSWMGIW